MGSKVDKIIPGFPRAIGGVLVGNPVWLAPMAGITFGSLRRFYGELGAGLVHTEMVSAVGLCHKGRKTKELLSGCDEERPVALQLFGANADDLARGAEIALGLRRFEALEVNMACPMPKVTKRGCGSRLLYDQREAASIVKTLKRFGLPVWSKVRIMPPELSATTADFCGELFAAGADFIFVHGRTAAQRYDGTASRDEVEKVEAEADGPRILSRQNPKRSFVDRKSRDAYDEGFKLGACSAVREYIENLEYDARQLGIRESYAEALKDIPVIVCTSKGQETDKIWGLRQGAVDYLVKPLNPEELLKRVAALP